MQITDYRVSGPDWVGHGQEMDCNRCEPTCPTRQQPSRQPQQQKRLLVQLPYPASRCFSPSHCAIAPALAETSACQQLFVRNVTLDTLEYHSSVKCKAASSHSTLVLTRASRALVSVCLRQASTAQMHDVSARVCL